MQIYSRQFYITKPAAILLFALGMLAALLWYEDIRNDQRYSIAVIAPAPLYSFPPHEYPRSNPIIDTLQIGQPLSVKRVRYGKDFETMRVETPAGQSGWVITGEGIEVLSRGGQNANQSPN